MIFRDVFKRRYRVGLINIDFDYLMLVVVTYSGMHLMISHGFPVVEQVSLVISCYVVLLYDVHQTVKDPSGYYLIIVELSSGCNSLNSF